MGVNWLQDSLKFTVKEKDPPIPNIQVCLGDHFFSIKDQSETFQQNEFQLIEMPFHSK